MPPIRTIAAAAIKPAKTERSHEENQERYVLLLHRSYFQSTYLSIRAYIAASRRSDRSLEARVESARRASEIHKRRTGRSLRVTEQDVVNEEMYEEEDDDLPSQYRRLTASLNTSSSDFNRRLATYLTTNVAMREALDRAIAQQNGQQPGLWNPQLQQQQTPHQTFFGQSFPQNPTMIPPSMMHYRSPVFNNTQAQSINSDGHRPRPASISTNNHMHASSSPGSTMASPMANFSFDQQNSIGLQSPTSSTTAGAPRPTNRPHSGTARAGVNGAHAQTEPSTPPFASLNRAEHGQGFTQSDSELQQGAQHLTSPQVLSPLTSPHAPFSTQLPMETQMFFTNQGMNLASDVKMCQPPFYSYNPNFANSKSISHQTGQGMSQTLALSAFETKMEPTAWPTPPSTEDTMSAYNATSDPNFGFDAQGSDDFSNVSWEGVLTDGHPTPADEFSSLIDVSLWENEAAPAA